MGVELNDDEDDADAILTEEGMCLKVAKVAGTKTFSVTAGISEDVVGEGRTAIAAILATIKSLSPTAPKRQVRALLLAGALTLGAEDAIKSIRDLYEDEDDDELDDDELDDEDELDDDEPDDEPVMRRRRS